MGWGEGRVGVHLVKRGGESAWLHVGGVGGSVG